MTRFFKCGVIALFFALGMGSYGCREVKKIAGFDEERWLSDRDGCKGVRAEVWKQFEPVKANMLGYHENDLKQLLGVPTARNLMEKGQKTLTYSISGAAACKDSLPTKNLMLRLNATGYVSEVQVIEP